MYAESVIKKKRPALIEFGRRLRLLRGKLTTAQFAKLSGVTDGAVRMWESGARQPSIENIESICDILKVSADDLFGKTFAPSIVDHKSIYREAASVLFAYGKAAPDLQASIRRQLGIDPPLDQAVMESEMSQFLATPAKPQSKAGEGE